MKNIIIILLIMFLVVIGSIQLLKAINVIYNHKQRIIEVYNDTLLQEIENVESQASIDREITN